MPKKQKVVLTKKVPFHQSREISESIWNLHNEMRWCFNKGVKMAFDNENLSRFDAQKILTVLRSEIEWGRGVATMQRANLINGLKSIRLAQSNRKKLGLPEIKSPNEYFRNKQYGRQPAIFSYQSLVVKDGTINVGFAKLRLKTHEYDWMKCLSYQIVEATKRINKYTKPKNRTYAIYLQFEHVPVLRTAGNAIGIDLGVTNMMGVATLEEQTAFNVKMPNRCKRHKNDEISQLQSKLSKVKKGGRRHGEITRKMKRLRGKQVNSQNDCIRNTVKQVCGGASLVAIEDLDINSMTSKKRQYHASMKASKTKASKTKDAGKTTKTCETKAAKQQKKRKPGLKGRNRSIYYSSMGKIKDWIIHFCKKHGIELHKVYPRYTSQACHECGLIDKRSRSGEKFHCISCGMEFHADENAAIVILLRMLRRIYKVVGKIIVKQKGGTVGLNGPVWKEKTNPIRFQEGRKGTNPDVPIEWPEESDVPSVPSDMLLKKHVSVAI